MSDRDRESIDQAPPTDVERTQVLATLIHKRISELHTARRAEGFTPALARELHVLERLRDEWLLEHNQ